MDGKQHIREPNWLVLFHPHLVATLCSSRENVDAQLLYESLMNPIHTAQVPRTCLRWSNKYISSSDILVLRTFDLISHLIFWSDFFNKSNCRPVHFIICLCRFIDFRDHIENTQRPSGCLFGRSKLSRYPGIWATKRWAPNVTSVFFQWEWHGGPTISRVHIKPPVIHLTNPSNTWSKSSMEWMLCLEFFFPISEDSNFPWQIWKTNHRASPKRKKATAIFFFGLSCVNRSL